MSFRRGPIFCFALRLCLGWEAWAQDPAQYHQGYVDQSAPAYESGGTYSGGTDYNRVYDRAIQQLKDQQALRRRRAPTPAKARAKKVESIRASEIFLDNLGVCSFRTRTGRAWDVPPPCFKNIPDQATARRIGLFNGDRVLAINGVAYPPGLPVAEVCRRLNQGYQRNQVIRVHRGYGLGAPFEWEGDVTVQWGFLWKCGK